MCQLRHHIQNLCILSSNQCLTTEHQEGCYTLRNHQEQPEVHQLICSPICISSIQVPIVEQAQVIQ